MDVAAMVDDEVTVSVGIISARNVGVLRDLRFGESDFTVVVALIVPAVTIRGLASTSRAEVLREAAAGAGAGVGAGATASGDAKPPTSALARASVASKSLMLNC
jgi:hypothetical protein